MNTHRVTSRRQFLTSAAAALAAPMIVPRSVFGASSIAPGEANTWLDRPRRDPWQLPNV